MRRSLTVIVIMLILGVFQGKGQSEELPLWELGPGMAGLSLPDYRGSDEQRFYAAPGPYLIYRGEKIKVDRRGVYTDLFKADKVNLDISVGAGVPVNSDKNTARSGMPDLDPTFEIGPSLEIQLYANDMEDRFLSFKVSLRSVIASDFIHYKSVGLVLNPLFKLKANDAGPGGGWDVGLFLGPLFATESNHDYYYEVTPEFSTSSRPEHNAKGGYSGIRGGFMFTKTFGRLLIGSFGIYDNLQGAAFNSSPLIRQDHSFIIGIGVAWVLVKSKTLVSDQ